MKAVISIPAYNEATSIEKVIRSIHAVMQKEKYPYEVIVIDDGSTDNTPEAAKKAGARIISHPYNYGLAETFRTEIKEFLRSGADIFVHIDADGQYNPADIPYLIKEIKNGYDLVLGNRFAGSIESMPVMKRFGNVMFSRAISRIIKHRIGDAQTGFRAFTRNIAKNVPITSTHTYTQEQIIRAVRQKYKIKEIPVHFARRNGESRLLKNPFEYAIKAWINIFRIYRDYDPLRFFGKIGAFFLLTGIILGLSIFILFLKTGKVSHLPLTILTLLLITLGVQVIIFGFLADMKKE